MSKDYKVQWTPELREAVDNRIIDYLSQGYSQQEAEDKALQDQLDHTTFNFSDDVVVTAKAPQKKQVAVETDWDPGYTKFMSGQRYYADKKHKNYLDQQRNDMTSSIRETTDKWGHAIGSGIEIASGFTPLWWVAPAVRTGLDLSERDYKGAALNAGLAFVAPYTVSKGIQYITPYTKSAILASKLNRQIRNTKLPQSQLTTSNTDAFVFKPNYGYQRINKSNPKTSLAFFEKSPVETSSASVSPTTNIKLTNHLQGDDAAQMFNEYAKGYTLPATETENIRQLRAYVAEARERYGLVGNDKVSDETILKALHKHVDELGGNTAARNIDGEPQLLFRGDTKRYTELKPRVSPEELVTMGGTMDNSLGTLFLGELPGTGVEGQGLERYLVHGREFNGNKRLIGSGTGAHVVSPSGDRVSEFDAIASFPHGSRHLVTHTTSRGIPHSYYKLPSTYSSTGVNDINGFVVRTPNMRNASKEISVLNDDFLVQASPDKVSYYGPRRRVQLDKDGFPLLVDESGNVVGNALAGSSERSAMAQHYRHVLDDAKLHNQGLLKSEGGSTNGVPGNYLRDEHTHFNYFALPNFNIQNAKHILPYDLRIPRNWLDPNIFRIVVPTALTLGGAGTAVHNSQPQYQKQGGPIHSKNNNKGKFAKVRDYVDYKNIK